MSVSDRLHLRLLSPNDGILKRRHANRPSSHTPRVDPLHTAEYNSPNYCYSTIWAAYVTDSVSRLSSYWISSLKCNDPS